MRAKKEKSTGKAERSAAGADAMGNAGVAKAASFTPKKVLVIGSGPIVIGQSAEFDYSGSQACTSLREEGITVVLVNSNPATIQTDSDIADIIYIEPLRIEFLEKIIEREKPDGLLATMGGQTGLNLAVELEKAGILAKHNVKLIGTGIDAIDTAEDRGKFAAMCREIGEPIPESIAANSLEEALMFASTHSYPLILRPAFTLGGTGGGIARNEEQLRDFMTLGLNLSPTHQVLVEESVIGWAELEYEVMRDAYDNCITICNMENMDPMGIHTGESVVVAPSQTLSDNEYHMLRNAALKIIRRLKIIGGCNIQFALNQKTGEYIIVEVNPRLSRSSALASKATGYPIARVAAKLALGKSLYEVKNAVTKTTPASFEPALDYAVVKIPRWPFDKMPEGNRTLGTQMKSTGEVMAVGRTFEESFLKALRSLEIRTPKLKDEDLEFHITAPTDLRHIAILEAIRRDKHTLAQIHSLSGINMWFLKKFANIVALEREISSKQLDAQILLRAKRMGFSDKWISLLTGKNKTEIRAFRKSQGILPVYKMVDTCAAEFDAKTPYYYSTYEQENESIARGKRRVIIIGSGPIRIGQGIEFDYCCCHASFTLRKMGIESVMINNNPETISTDFDASDRLYFEPLTFEDVMNVIELERPEGVIVALGGQTSINLAEQLHNAGVRILGTQIEGIDLAEDRDKFKQLLQKLGIPQPNNGVATSEKEALAVAAQITYPVVVRPSYVIAGRAMQIIYDDAELSQYITEAVEVSENRPVLIDKYIERAIEVEVDGICDGKRLFVGGIMEHIERAGVHSGDASCVTPCVRLKPEVQEQLLEYSEKIALSLKIIGAINIQYVVKDDKILVLEANPRASRTMPYLSKAIGIPLLKIATEVTMGKTLDELKMPLNPPKLSHYAVKSVVFPFLKLRGVDFVLGPEMKSTGESMGIDLTFPRAYYKALLGANLRLKFSGNVAISLKDGDKERGGELASAFQKLGYKVSATDGTAKYMENVLRMKKISEGTPNILTLLESGWLDLIINTPSKGKRANTDGFKIRRAALERNIPCITNFEAALALAEALEEARNSELTIQPLSQYYKKEKKG